MKIVVTGSEGFIGSELVRQLHQMGHTVIGCDRKAFQEVVTLSRFGGTSLEGTGAIVHLAAQTSVFNDNLRQIEEDNIRAFMDVVELSNRLGCRLIYASSSCAANVTSLYGLTKRFNEEFASIYAHDAVGVRFHNVYGPGQRQGTLLAVAMECVAKGEPITLFNNGRNRRHFTFIEDIVAGIVKLLRLDSRGVVNICNPEETTTLEFIQCLAEHVPVRYTLTDQVRPFDKEVQAVDTSLDGIGISYTRLKAGIYKTMMRWNIGKDILND